MIKISMLPHSTQSKKLPLETYVQEYNQRSRKMEYKGVKHEKHT